MNPEKTDILYQGQNLKYLSDNTILPDDSIDLIVTSPPYAERRNGSYGGIHPNKYVAWFLPIAEQLLRVLKPDGSFVLNIKEHCRNNRRKRPRFEGSSSQ